MKKVILLMLVVIMASTLMMAVSPLRLVRIYVINKSSHTIYMELKGQINENLYYLTIPKGTKKLPEYSEYTVVEDIYTRSTWYGPGSLGCEGFKSTGELWAVKQMKLVFTPCGQFINWPGEPTWGEKVVYFKYIDGGWWKGTVGCWYVVKTWTFRSPPKGSCFYLYKY